MINRLRYITNCCIRITVILTILHDVAVESVKKRKRTLTKYLAVYSQVRMIVGIVVCVGMLLVGAYRTYENCVRYNGDIATNVFLFVSCDIILFLYIELPVVLERKRIKRSLDAALLVCPLDEILHDFESGKRVLRGKLVVGKRWIFGRETNNIIDGKMISHLQKATYTNSDGHRRGRIVATGVGEGEKCISTLTTEEFIGRDAVAAIILIEDTIARLAREKTMEE